MSPHYVPVPVEDLVTRIRDLREELRPAERRVAEVVLADLGSAPRLSNGELARRADVSEPTITRFCRAVGCEGVRDFKIKLAQSLAAGTPYLHRAVKAGDNFSEMARKVFEGTIEALRTTQDQLDSKKLDQAAKALSKARRVFIFGVGAGSGIVALDAQFRFTRLDLSATAYTDGHLQLTAAAAAREGDLVLAISHTGRSQEVIRASQLARRYGAKVVALTSPGSPLAKACDVPLLLKVPEDTDLYTPSTSRLAHLAVVDILSVAVALHKGPTALEGLKRIKQALASQRVGLLVEPEDLLPKKGR